MRIVRKTSRKAGLPPGSVVYTGEARHEEVKVEVIDYTESDFQERTVDVEESLKFRDKKSITWINVTGVHDTDIITKLGNHYGLHPLVMEDIVHTTQRPKIEDMDNYLFIVLKMIYFGQKEINIEQVSLVLGENFVISFQEKEGDVFDNVRERIRNSKGRIRKMQADYLAYTLMDAIVDNYFIILEKLGDQTEDLEKELMENPDPGTLNTIHKMKRELIFLRKSVWPLREVISNIQRGESHLVRKSSKLYFNDIYDHTIQVIDNVETLRDVVSGMLDTYLSSVSNRMNEVMKVLTIIATVFIPLTFIAGIYGMNFEFMPELKWRYAYFVVWGVMFVVALIMFFYFKKKKWI